METLRRAIVATGDFCGRRATRSPNAAGGGLWPREFSRRNQPKFRVCQKRARIRSPNPRGYCPPGGGAVGYAPGIQCKRAPETDCAFGSRANRRWDCDRSAPRRGARFRLRAPRWPMPPRPPPRAELRRPRRFNPYGQRRRGRLRRLGLRRSRQRSPRRLRLRRRARLCRASLRRRFHWKSGPPAWRRSIRTKFAAAPAAPCARRASKRFSVKGIPAPG